MINTYDFQVEQPEIFSQLAVRDLLFLHYKCPQEEEKVNLFTHLNKIIFVLHGKKLIHRPGRSVLLTDNTAIFFKKTAYNQERFYEIDWEVLCFYCPDHYLKKVFREYRLQLPLKEIPATQPDSLIEISLNEVTLAYFYSILPYFKQKPAPSEDLIELKFRELIVNIISNPANSAFLAYVKSLSDLDKPQLQEIMEANYTFNLSLSDFSRLAQRSLASFKREFTRTFQSSPGKWLAEKRLHHARVLLDTSTKNVTEVANDSGFENSTHFSRVFKEKYGLSPMQYRKARPLIETV